MCHKLGDRTNEALMQEEDGQTALCCKQMRGGLACWKLLYGQCFEAQSSSSITCRGTKFMLDLPLAHEHAILPLFTLISILKATVFYILPFTILYLELCNVPEMK